MSLRIAIQPDRIRHRNGRQQSFSDRWIELAAHHGVEVRTVDAFAPDFFNRLDACDGFMWRFGYHPVPRLFAQRLFAAIEHGLGLPTFPSHKTAWHFEDKIGQHYLLQAAEIPTPDTRVFWHKDAALDFCRRASYPIVMKLGSGFQSSNVRLLRSRTDAERWVDRMFGAGVTTIEPASSPLRSAVRHVRNLVRRLAGRPVRHELDRCELQRGYFYLQQFLDHNEFDTRVTVIGNRAFAFRRFNRPGDFRASGSGRIDWDPAHIDLQSVRLGYRVAQRLGTQSVAIDVLRRGEERVTNEISYTYASWAVSECPGHWTLQGDAESGRLTWVDGKMAAEDAIFADFVTALRSRGESAVAWQAAVG